MKEMIIEIDKLGRTLGIRKIEKENYILCFNTEIKDEGTGLYIVDKKTLETIKKSIDLFLKTR